MRRQVNLTPVAVQAIASGNDDSSAVLQLLQRWSDAPSCDSRVEMVRRPGEERLLADHMEVSRA